MLDNLGSNPFLLEAWLTLFPLTYVAHIAEEYWGGGGYSKYVLTTYSVELSPQRFLWLQAVGVSLMGLGVVVGIALRFPITMLAMLSTIVLGNALVHTLRSIKEWMYTPGLITAVALWLPLGCISLVALWPFISASKLVLALIVGVVTNGVVELITMRRIKDEGNH
jgi:hypothetical protein